LRIALCSVTADIGDVVLQAAAEWAAGVAEVVLYNGHFLKMEEHSVAKLV
jgi:hypothetical protein